MKKREQKLSDKRVEQIQELASKIEDDLREMAIAPEDELEVFAEAVALRKHLKSKAYGVGKRRIFYPR